MNCLTESELQLPFRNVCDKYADFDYCAGCVIRKLRRKLHMSGSDVGYAIGYSQQQVSRYERGSSRFTLTILNQFAEVLGITLWDLLDAIKLFYFTRYDDYLRHDNGSLINKNEKIGSRML